MLCQSIGVTPFSVTANRDGTTTVLQLVGELDMATVPQLRTVAFAELDQPGCEVLALDVAGLDFLDSTGIGSWVEIRRRAADSGKRVVVREMPPYIHRILEIGSLTSLFAEQAEHQG